MNYFEVLELSIEKIQGEDEATIKKLVKDAHTRLFALTVGAYANVPRPDGRTQAQWQVILNDAKVTLIDPQKRLEHIATINPPLNQLEEVANRYQRYHHCCYWYFKKRRNRGFFW